MFAAVLGSLVLALAVLYWVPIRQWFGHWGATGADLSRAMAATDGSPR